MSDYELQQRKASYRETVDDIRKAWLTCRYAPLLRDYTKFLLDRFDDLEREIARKDEALRFYADPDNYTVTLDGFKDIVESTVDTDDGARAREAIAPLSPNNDDA